MTYAVEFGQDSMTVRMGDGSVVFSGIGAGTVGIKQSGAGMALIIQPGAGVEPDGLRLLAGNRGRFRAAPWRFNGDVAFVDMLF